MPQDALSTENPKPTSSAVESEAAADRSMSEDVVSRRALVTTFLGAVGVAAISSCANDGQGGSTADEADTSSLAQVTQALTGAVMQWADTVLGVAPTNPPTARTGDLATKNSSAVGNAIVVVAKGCVTAGDGGGGVFYWEAGVTTGDDGGTIIVPSPSPTGRWRRIYSGAVDVKWFGARGDGTTPDQPAIQLAINAGPRKIFFPSGTYNIASSLWVTRDCVLTGDCPGAAAAPSIVYSGSDYALKVNSDVLHLGTGSATLVTNFGIERMRVSAPNGKGIKFGSAIVGRVTLDHVDVDNCAGHAMDFGGSVYFVAMRKCHISRTRGIEVLEACDLFSMENCGFYRNKDYDLVLSTPTYRIVHCDFEVNEGAATNLNKANILLKALSVTSGYGTIEDCRFGPEDVGIQVPPHDIEFALGDAVIVRGVRLIRNRHFSALPLALGRKQCPILLNTGLGDFSMYGETVVNYQLADIYFKTDGADAVAASSAIDSNVIDNLYAVPDDLKPVFSQRNQNEGRFVACRSGQPISKYECVSVEAWESLVGMRGVMRVYRTITGSSDYSKHIVGVAMHGVDGDKNLSVAQHGCVIRTASPNAFNTSSSYVNAPVYMDANGVASLTPTFPVKKIGTVLTVATAGSFRVDLSEPTQWTSMPTFGKWKAGDLARKSSPIVAGTSGSKYVVTGWTRLTDSNVGGTNNTLNTDWVEMRTLTGT